MVKIFDGNEDSPKATAEVSFRVSRGSMGVPPRPIVISGVSIEVRGRSWSEDAAEELGHAIIAAARMAREEARKR